MPMPGDGISCDCWVTTMRIVNECEALFETDPQHQYPVREMREMPLGEMLNLAQKLAQQWETMNGCVSFEDHLSPQLIRVVTDAIGRVLAIYEMATEEMHENMPRSNGLFNWDSSHVFVGGVQIEDLQEIAIITQEALRHSVIRLGAMLQDMEEETHPYGPEDSSNLEQPLQCSEVQVLIGRLFRLLGKINEVDC